MLWHLVENGSFALSRRTDSRIGWVRGFVASSRRDRRAGELRMTWPIRETSFASAFNI
jgi:hypothetical protein